MNKSIREVCEQQVNADTTGERGSDDYHRGRRSAFREVIRQIDSERLERLSEWAERHRKIEVKT
jgi:hypothetical protein